MAVDLDSAENEAAWREIAHLLPDDFDATVKRAATVHVRSGGVARDRALNPIIERLRQALIALADEHGNRVVKYDESEPRDWHGRWTADGSDDVAGPSGGAAVPQGALPPMSPAEFRKAYRGHLFAKDKSFGPYGQRALAQIDQLNKELHIPYVRNGPNVAFHEQAPSVVASSQGAGIYLNPTFYGPNGKMSGWDNAFHPDGCSTAEGYVAHEYGHVMDWYLSAGSNGRSLAESDPAWPKEATKDYMAWRQTAIDNPVSTYARTNDKEAVAEAFSAAYASTSTDPAYAAIGLRAVLEKYGVAVKAAGPDLTKYSPDQPRDDHGRWVSEGGLTADYLPGDLGELFDQMGVDTGHPLGEGHHHVKDLGHPHLGDHHHGHVSLRDASGMIAAWSWKAALADLTKYSPDQPRDDRGRWTDGSGFDEATVKAQLEARKVYVDFTGIAPAFRGMVAEAANGFRDRFPGQPSLLIKTEHPFVYRHQDDPIAETQGYMVKLNPDWFGPKGPARFAEYNVTDRLAGWSAVPGPEGVLWHEFGHVVDWMDYFGGAEALRATGGSAETGSGRRDERERFAEAFSQVFLTPKDDWGRDARSVAGWLGTQKATEYIAKSADLRKYDPSEPRDDHGRWTADGTSGGATPVDLSDRTVFRQADGTLTRWPTVEQAIEDYSKLHPDTKVDFPPDVKSVEAMAALDQLDRLQGKFPKVPITGISVQTDPKDPAFYKREDHIDPVGVCKAVPTYGGASEIVLSDDWRALASAKPLYWPNNGFHPSGTNDPAGILTHEFGHALENYVDDAPGRSNEKFDWLHASGDYYDGTMGVIQMMQDVSGYAKTNDVEAWAETFASAYAPGATATEAGDTMAQWLDGMGYGK